MGSTSACDGKIAFGGGGGSAASLHSYKDSFQMSDSDRDYYAVLGLSPDATGVLIKAAYRALAKQYHPDTQTAEDQVLTKKFTELHDAYKVLSNPLARKTYDREKGYNEADELSSTLNEEEETRIEPDEIWRETEIKFPEINQIHAQFCLISLALANHFSLAILNGKYGDNPNAFASKLEKEFFNKYFGNREAVQTLAKRLLLSGHKLAARELNEAIKSGKLEKKNVWENYVAIVEDRYPDIVATNGPQFDGGIFVQAENLDDQKTAQNKKQGKHTAPGRSFKHYGFVTKFALSVVTIIVGLSILGFIIGRKAQLEQSSAEPSEQTNKKIYDRIVGDREILGGQIVPTDETPVQLANSRGQPPESTSDQPLGTVDNASPLPLPLPPGDRGQSTVAEESSLVEEPTMSQPKANLKSATSSKTALISKRDLSGGFAYPEVTVDELPYGNEQTTALDAEIQSVANKDENITTITKAPLPQPVNESSRCFME